MNIKEILKKYEITLSAFAKKLNISRPTLDTYISTYEKTGKVNNQKIQIVFEKIFGKVDNVPVKMQPIMPTIEFYKILDGYSKMLTREKILGMSDLTPHQSDLISSIINLMINDIKSEDYNENIYKFIRFIILNYRTIDYLVDTALYYLTLNSIIDYEKLDKSQQLNVVTYFMLIKKIKDISVKDEDMEKFRNRVSQIKSEKEETNKKIKSELQKVLKTKLAEANENGVDLDKMTISQLIELLKK